MEVTTTTNRIYPLIAAAAALTVVSLVGGAAIVGLPNFHRAITAAQARPEVVTSSLIPQAQQSLLLSAAKQNDDYRPAVHQAHQRYCAAPKEKTERANTTSEVAQTKPIPHYSPGTVYQKTASVAQNSPLGIGSSTLVGGLVGSRFGGGNGRTLAEIASAVGGGYVGNEITKRNL